MIWRCRIRRPNRTGPSSPLRRGGSGGRCRPRPPGPRRGGGRAPAGDRRPRRTRRSRGAAPPSRASAAPPSPRRRCDSAAPAPRRSRRPSWPAGPRSRPATTLTISRLEIGGPRSSASLSARSMRMCHPQRCRPDHPAIIGSARGRPLIFVGRICRPGERRTAPDDGRPAGSRPSRRSCAAASRSRRCGIR